MRYICYNFSTVSLLELFVKLRGYLRTSMPQNQSLRIGATKSVCAPNWNCQSTLVLNSLWVEY